MANSAEDDERRRWTSFARVLDELVDDYVHEPSDAMKAEKIIQQRAQDLREQYRTPDKGENA